MRSACSRTAAATLTYVYSDQMAVVGPLAVEAEPHSFDLCADHSNGLTVPSGWSVLRLAAEPEEPSHDDLLALADAVREAGQQNPDSTMPEGSDDGPRLRVVRDAPD